MPIEIHPECKTRLIDAIAKGIPEISVRNGKFLNRPSYIVALFPAEEAVPEHGKLRKELIESIDEFPILQFVSDQVSRELAKLEYQSDSDEMPLSRVAAFSNAAEAAKLLVEQIESLPWTYTLTIKLPRSCSTLLPPEVEEFAISKKMRIVRLSGKLAGEYPLTTGDKKIDDQIHSRTILSMLAGEDEKWDADSVYLQMMGEGYIDQYGITSLAGNSERALRAVAGFGLAIRLFQTEAKYDLVVEKSPFYVHQFSNGKWKLAGRFDLAEDKSRALHMLTLNTLDGVLKDDKQKHQWAIAKLLEMRLIFAMDEKADPIRLASQWLFDSHTGRDELSNFIQAMVVLEILLGDKGISDEIGLGQLLRNRCAYLIGKSHQDRTEILKKFNEIYQVRSQIVHRGKHKLNVKERGLYHSLQWMCRRVIQEEVELFEADAKRQKEDESKNQPAKLSAPNKSLADSPTS